MTLVVGLPCADAVILAAEQEEASGYTTRRFIKKLKLYAENNWSLAFSGAGDGSVIDNAEQRISGWLGGRSDFTGRELLDAVDEILATVHDRYIDKDPRSEGITLIMGASCSDGLFLIETAKRVPWFLERPACAGFGGEIAGYLINRLHDPEDDWRTAAKKIGLASEEAKNASRECGGSIDFMVLQRPPDPTWRELGRGFYYEIEFECQASVIADLLCKSIIGNFPAQAERYKGYCDQHRPTPNEEDLPVALPKLNEEQIDEILERTRRRLERENRPEADSITL